MARGSIFKRCRICRREGKTGLEQCSHKEASYLIAYRFGNKQKRETVGPNKKDAEKLLAQRLSEINNGTYLKPEDITFKEFAYKWLAEYAKPRVKQRTHTIYEGSIRTHLLPGIGETYLADVTHEDIQSVLAKLLETRKANTVNKTLKLLKTIMKYARRWKYITESPAQDIDSFREEHEEMDYLNPTEINLLLKHSREPFRTIFLTAILTGMRRGELLALQWGDIDWNSNLLFVRRSIYFDYKMDKSETRWRFDTPKTKGSRRAIVLSPKLKEALEIHRLTALTNPWDLVFTNTDGNPVDPNNMVKRDFHTTLAFAGLRKVRFHDLRHTYTSLLIEQGENIKFIQSQLGHASCQTTLDRYAHLMPVNTQNVGSKIDRQIFEVINPTVVASLI